MILTEDISRGKNPPVVFEKKIANITHVTFQSSKNHTTTLKEWLDTSGTDSFVVLHEGKIVAEHYYHGMNELSKHQMFSVTKSFVGTIALSLVVKNKLNPEELVVKIIPELKGTAFEHAKVREVMDMTTALAYHENYDDENSDFYKYYFSISNLNEKKGSATSLRKYIEKIKAAKRKVGEEKFEYATPNSDVLAWIVERVTGKKFHELLPKMIWEKLGVDSDAYLIVDREGVSFLGAGLNATARDIAKFGQMILQEGVFNGVRIFPQAAILEIRKGGDQKAFARSQDAAAFPGFSYKSQWWVSHDDHGAFMAIGIFGQWVYVDPLAQVVVVKQSSLRVADSDENAVNAYRAMHAIGNHFLNLR